MHRNIILLYIIKACKWFMLYMPVIYLFYKENDFNTTELFTLHAIYSVVIAILEVPSGYIADVWGRKPAIIFGTLFGIIGFAFYSGSYGLIGFIIAEILLGIGQSLISGADSAILYDTLLEYKKESKYIKLEGKITALGNLAESLAGLFVSIFVFQLIRTYFYIQTGFSFLAFLAALFLTEPKLHFKRKKPGFKDIWQIVHYAFNKNKLLRNFVTLSAIIGFASLTMAWYAQPVFYEVGLKKSYYGYAWVLLNLLVALGSLMAHRIDKLFKLNITLLFLIIPLSAGFLIVGQINSFIVFVPMVIFYFVRGTAHPIFKKYINDLSNSASRATILSLRSLLIRIFYSTLGPVLGYISDNISLKISMGLCGISVFIPSVIFMFLILKSNYKSNTNPS